LILLRARTRATARPRGAARQIPIGSTHSVRYRQYYSYFASAHPDLVNLPLVLTEGGIDGAGPWSTRGDAQKFQNWLTWFDREIRKDAYCLGLTLFQIGETGQWNGFNVEPVAGLIASYLSANPGTSAPPALVRCVRETNTLLTLQFTAPVHPNAATNPANYNIRLAGTNALDVLSASVADTNVTLVTSTPIAGADYVAIASNLVHMLATTNKPSSASVYSEHGYGVGKFACPVIFVRMLSKSL